MSKKYICEPKYNSFYGEVLQALEDYSFACRYPKRASKKKIAWEFYGLVLQRIEQEIKKLNI